MLITGLAMLIDTLVGPNDQLQWMDRWMDRRERFNDGDGNDKSIHSLDGWMDD